VDDTNFTVRQSPNTRTLIFSQRNLTKILPYRCAHFEFEDVISQIDSVRLVTPRINFPTRRHSFAKQLAYHTPLRLNSGTERLPVDEDYDLLLIICGNPTDLLRIDAIKDWRKRCKKAICLIDEIWATEVKSYRNFVRMLEKFDLVVLYYSQSVKAVSELIGDKCMFLPPGVDTMRFCPYPDTPQRSIDVYSVGRRSSITHREILKMAEEDDLFYLYDSMSADQVLNPTEHRMLFANLLKRSRYFIVNPGLIDRPDIRGTQIEIGNRYFEAAAAGSILLGQRPLNGQFEQLFDWPDALIDLPYNSPDVAKVMTELDRQPERQDAIRQMNVQQALLRHDWCYRWEAILKAAGLRALPQLNARKEALRKLAGGLSQDRVWRPTASSDVILTSAPPLAD
jgi:hypothetical protein